MADIGDNSANKELIQLAERYERLAEEKKSIADDMKDVMAETKARGYDTKMFRQMLKERAMDEHERQERYALEETYRIAFLLS